MPTYDYVCEGCEYHFEHFQSMSSRRLRKCPECGERKLVRLVGSGAGLIFKGSGFYETDYKRKSSPSPSACSGSKKSEGTTAKASEKTSAGTSNDGAGDD